MHLTLSKYCLHLCLISSSFTKTLVEVPIPPPARFAVFFATLYFSMLSALLSRYRRRKHTFFSLIAFWTSSFHHQVSLASTLLPLVTPNSSEAILRTHVAIFIHILFASPPSSQGPSFMTLSLKA